MEKQLEVPEGYVTVNHDLGIFLDPEKYIPITRLNDEGAALLKLGLIMENFLTVFITNVRAPGTEVYIKTTGRYFLQKLETSVALGLPVSIADALKAFNTLRNKFAHEIDYVMTDEDYEVAERKVNAITREEVNPANRFNVDGIRLMFEDGVDSLVFIRNTDYATPTKQKKILRLVGTAYILANKCAFFTLNELHRQGKLSLG